MARVVPFQAYRYNTKRFGKDVTRLVSPPYDVIDKCLEKKLKDDRINVSNIILGDEGDAYTVAARRLQRWLEDGVLVEDEDKCFYIYEQKFSGFDGSPRVRSGIIGLVKLQDFSEGVVMPHEKTIPKHKADRLELMCAAKGDVEQVFLLYDDPSEEIETMLLQARKKEEELRFLDSEGVHHRLVKISDPKMVERMSRLFEPVNLLIADGHHRYETALEYKRMVRSKTNDKGELPCDFIMATLVSFRNPGLVIYPTHRLVQNVQPALLEKLPKALEEEFEVDHFPGPDELAEAVELSSRHAFGVWIPTTNTLIRAIPKADASASNPLEDLPVWIVQEKVLKKLLGFTPEMLDTKVNIDYVKGTAPTKEAMGTGEYQACFFVKPPTVQQVMAVAQSGQKMPHKSTYFFPKIWSGTLFYLFDRPKQPVKQ